MRWIGPSLLVLALVFSTGGVAIVGQAGSTDGKSEPQQSVAPVDQSIATQAEPSQCEVPARRSAPGQPRALKDAADNKSIVLNTSGYNYALEGEWRPNPVAKPQGVPAGVLPNPQDAAPPASPEPK